MPAAIESATLSAGAGNAVDFDRAAVGLDHAAQNLHQGRLAGAVFADQADHLAGAHVHAEVGQRQNAGIGLAKSRQPAGTAQSD